jgi:hypothetical protein
VLRARRGADEHAHFLFVIANGIVWQCALFEALYNAPAVTHVVGVPAFTPVSGVAVQVTMAANNAHHLCYRTDGTDPTCSGTLCGAGSTKYTTALAPPAQLKAVACDASTNLATAVTSATFSAGLCFRIPYPFACVRAGICVAWVSSSMLSMHAYVASGLPRRCFGDFSSRAYVPL